MIFYVYIDPETVSVAYQHGDHAVQNLISILQGFVDNCFIAEFHDESVQLRLKEVIENLPEGFDRKQIMVLLSTLKTRNRFIYCLTPDYSYQKPLLRSVKEQAAEVLLDLILLPELLPEDEKIAVATSLSSYQRSHFEEERRELARHGVTLPPGQFLQKELLDRYFKKALLYARSIELCDRMFGRKYSAHYQYSVEILLLWLSNILLEPSRCIITFHCEEPDDQSRSLENLKTDLANCKRGRLRELGLKLFLYQSEASSAHLPHDRFIVTDQIAIGIPRGLDFLDRDTGRNRDLTLDYKNKDDVHRLITGYTIEQRFDL